MALRALGGGELIGDAFVRYAYLDESGIGNAKYEPFVVVAGVVLHADKQLKAVERRLHELADKYVRPAQRAGFVFHAKEIYNGGAVFDRASYSLDRRKQILVDLCSIPQEFGLHAVMAYIDRRALTKQFPSAKRSDVAIAAQTIASTACLVAIERFMREPDQDGEVATLVYENNDQAKRWIRETHNELRKGQASEWLSESVYAEYLPLQRIAETAFFAEKDESSALQIADAIAFTLNRKLRGESDGDLFYEPLAPQLIVQPDFWVSGAAASAA